MSEFSYLRCHNRKSFTVFTRTRMAIFGGVLVGGGHGRLQGDRLLHGGLAHLVGDGERDEAGQQAGEQSSDEEGAGVHGRPQWHG